MQAKIFTEDENGIPVHWELDGADVSELTGNVNELMEWLGINSFAAHVGFGHGNGHPRALEGNAQTVTDNQTDNTFDPNKVKCGNCGGPAWNNNAGRGKSNPRGPDWTCKDKDNCWFRAWAKKDGTPGEWKPPAL